MIQINKVNFKAQRTLTVMASGQCQAANSRTRQPRPQRDKLKTGNRKAVDNYWAPKVKTRRYRIVVSPVLSFPEWKLTVGLDVGLRAKQGSEGNVGRTG